MSNEHRNEWGVRWASIGFLEKVLRNHSAVVNFSCENEIQFQIERLLMEPLNVVMLEDYLLGEAKVHAVIDEFDDVDAVVNNGTWNCVAFDWREFEKQTGVVVLGITDFLGALNVENLEEYVTADERAERKRKKRSS